MSAIEVGGHEFNNGVVVFADVGFEFVQRTENVVDCSVVGEQQFQQSLDLETRRLCSVS